MNGEIENLKKEITKLTLENNSLNEVLKKVKQYQIETQVAAGELRDVLELYNAARIYPSLIDPECYFNSGRNGLLNNELKIAREKYHNIKKDSDMLREEILALKNVINENISKLSKVNEYRLKSEVYEKYYSDLYKAFSKQKSQIDCLKQKYDDNDNEDVIKDLKILKPGTFKKYGSVLSLKTNFSSDDFHGQSNDKSTSSSSSIHSSSNIFNLIHPTSSVVLVSNRFITQNSSTTLQKNSNKANSPADLYIIVGNKQQTSSISSTSSTSSTSLTSSNIIKIAKQSSTNSLEPISHFSNSFVKTISSPQVPSASGKDLSSSSSSSNLIPSKSSNNQSVSQSLFVPVPPNSISDKSFSPSSSSSITSNSSPNTTSSSFVNGSYSSKIKVNKSHPLIVYCSSKYECQPLGGIFFFFFHFFFFFFFFDFFF
jgi:hypothetical protein